MGVYRRWASWAGRAGIMAAVWVGPALAQDREEGFGQCHAMAAPLSRLACYDDLTGFARAAAPSAETAVSEGDQAAEAEAAFVAEVLALVEGGDADDWGPVATALGAQNMAELSEGSIAVIEAALLEAVRPIPASRIEANLSGYRLLALLRPGTERYSDKVSQYEAALRAERMQAVARLERERDDLRETTFYKHPDEPRYIDTRSRIGLYIALPDGGRPILRMKTVYTEDSWLFVSRVEVSIDGEVSRLTSGEFQRDNDSDIWEWRDEVPSGVQLRLLREMAVADEVILRFTGQQYYDDKQLGSSDRRMIADVLRAYDEMIAMEAP